MKRILIAFAICTCALGAEYGPIAASRVIRGSGVPSSVACATLGDVSKVYVRYDAKAASSSLYVCAQTANGVFGWELTGGSGGTSVKVNNSSVADPNFQATTPAAESNYLNAKFQVSGSSVSAEVPTGTSAGTLALGNHTHGAYLTTTTFAIGIQRGSNLAPAFAASPNYTASNWTEGAGSMAINYTGANSFAPTTPLAIVAGQTYQVDLVCSAYTSGTFTVSLGGSTSPAVTPVANVQYRFYVTASTTANPTVAAASSGAQQMTFSSLSVKRAAYDPTSGANVPVIVDTNSGLTTALTVYQPPALAGWTFQEYVIAAYAITGKLANGTDTWYWGAGPYTTQMLTDAIRQTFFTLACYANGAWELAGTSGGVTPS